ncbi:prolyl 4-hydroxylase subunit alpha-2 [Drosophila mojavensis]|uniref:Prolyl 4-hydroxylase N-terminal domain-containing protein n=1 Tax=Drosophila mojavensis TaxID=7230 RepID=B4K9I1_DROMO|nr:prolyl 4-hydroxylase subunit alpha-2 [Drosophila mojavensis]EDW16641.2 uncharacterized protein Dmoj_GI22113 [Drosophila mojavensis]
MVVILCLLPLLLAAANAESIHVEELKNVLKLERELLYNFRSYVSALEERVNTMKGAIEEYSRLIKYADRRPDLYMTNPIFGFRLMNHIRYDWRLWQAVMMLSVGRQQIEMQQRLLALVPKADAHRRVAESLQSLFRFYNYKPAAFLMHRKKHLRLGPWDYYHMGRELFELGKYHEALEWLAVARVNYTASPHSELLGATDERINYMQSNTLKKLSQQKSISESLDEHLELLTAGRTRSTPVEHASVLEQQCRGNYERDFKLICELNTDFTPFMRLAPLRMEELLYDPLVMLYRNGIREREIAHLVNAFEGCPPSSMLTRIPGMKICSISNNFSPISIGLMERLVDMSAAELHMDKFFMLEYSPRDAFRLQDLYKFLGVKMNVDSTALFFLNDMDMGGAITLAKHELAAFPGRADALVFFFKDKFRITFCPNVVGKRLVLIQFLTYDD